MVKNVAMVYQVLSESVFAVHLVVTLYTLFGIVLVFRWPRQAYFHIPIVVWMILVNVADWFCPLTFLEDWLRSESGIAGYDSSLIEGFIIDLIDQYIHPIDRTRVDPRHNALIWAVVFSVINGVGYSVFAWTMRRRRRKHAAGD